MEFENILNFNEIVDDDHHKKFDDPTLANDNVSENTIA